MLHVVSLSGGTASAVAAKRVMDRYGKDQTRLWFANTSWEDEDLHRFMADCFRAWNMTADEYCDGRNPLQVADDEKMIFNQKHAYCSRILKQEPFMRHLKSLRPSAENPITVHLGLDWQEQHRHCAPKRIYESMDGVSVDFPLVWEPWQFNYQEIVRAWGVEPPRLYRYGFPHNNCGGRCVRQGKKEWMRLKTFFPDRFEEVADWEQNARSHGDARANYAIVRDRAGGGVRPLTLRALERRWSPVDESNHTDDLFGCFCEY
jgi:hypothetical protein